MSGRTLRERREVIGGRGMEGGERREGKGLKGGRCNWGREEANTHSSLMRAHQDEYLRYTRIP